MIYPDGSEASYEYDLRFNKRSKETDERGVITEYEYDDLGNMTRKVEAVGTDSERVTEYTYDGEGYQLTIKRLGDNNTADATTTMQYDASGNMTSVTDSEGNTTQFTSHDSMGNVLTKEDARGKTWTYEYDVMGRLTKITDPLNNFTQLFYDAVGNKTREVDAEGKEKLYNYDERNNLIKVTDALGNETLFEYNTDGKMTKQIDAEGKVVLYEYDNEGRLIKTTDGNGNEIQMEYDDTTGGGCSSCSGGNTGQPSKVTYPTFSKDYSYDLRGRKTLEKDVLSETEGFETLFDYDLSGNLTNKIDKESKTTNYEYDELSRLKKVTDSMNQDTQYVYDNRDNLVQLIDAKSQSTLFEYDRNNRLIKETRPMGEETTYQYNGAGNLIQKIDAKNQKVVYTYDDAGRLTEIRYFNPDDHVNPVKIVSFTYDKVGNLKTYNDGTTSGQYGYDNAYRKISEAVNYGGFQKSYAYEYYKNGTKKTFTGPDGITYTYTYNSNNQLTSVQIPGVGSITNASYNWSRPTMITLPGGSRKDYAYDPLMRVKQITSKDPGQNTLLNYQYTYDKMDNIQSKQTEHGDYTYDYDNLYRLAGADNPVQEDEAFTYDPVGNRLTSSGVSDWTYNTNNELTGYDNGSYVYDDNGNMTQKTVDGVVTKFFYNTEDRLIEVRDGSDSLIASYYYDPFGRRLWKEVGGTKTYFMYSDEGLVEEYDDGGVEIKTYGYKPGSTWTTDPLFMKIGSNYYFYHNDHLGTPQKLTSTNGAVVWSAKYKSFGKAEVDINSTIINPLRFPGQYEDLETGLYHNHFRYYAPRTAVYMTHDPIGLLSGINMLNYVGNNPINQIDPMGLTIEFGGGFGFNLAFFSFGISVRTETCCDDSGKLHKRTITSTCAGIELGLSVGTADPGPGKGGLSFNNPIGKCPKINSWEPEVYRTENNNFGFSSGLGIGAAWDKGNPNVTNIIAQIGISFHIYSGCSNKINQDFIIGPCCND